MVILNFPELTIFSEIVFLPSLPSSKLNGPIHGLLIRELSKFWKLIYQIILGRSYCLKSYICHNCYYVIMLQLLLLLS